MTVDVDFELMRLLSPAVEWAREQIETTPGHAGGLCFRADERCRDLLEQVLHHECAGMGCGPTSACSPECEASFESRDPAAEAEHIERLLKLPREAAEVLKTLCGECSNYARFENEDCRAHSTTQAEAMRDAIFLLIGET